MSRLIKHKTKVILYGFLAYDILSRMSSQCSYAVSINDPSAKAITKIYVTKVV